MTETKKSEWDSNLAFMMAMIGSAVGLGNIWRFPNVLYSNGGGSFMIPYIVSLFLLGISFVLVEYAVGFRFKKSLARILFSAHRRPYMANRKRCPFRKNVRKVIVPIRMGRRNPCWKKL